MLTTALSPEQDLHGFKNGVFVANTQDKEEVSIQQETFGLLLRQKPRRIGLKMTAMIDVIFLLLAFFVLTARFRSPEQFLPILLSSASAEQATSRFIEPLEIYISATENGSNLEFGAGNKFESVSIEQGRVNESLALFAKELRDMFESQKRTADDPIEIRCDDDLKWDHLVKIYNILYGMGAGNITFVINQ